MYGERSETQPFSLSINFCRRNNNPLFDRFNFFSDLSLVHTGDISGWSSALSVKLAMSAGEVNTEEESVAAEIDADAVSVVIDRRDVPGRETPLHLAVRLRDPICAEILMAADFLGLYSAARIRDFYMEMTFHFESSVIPFIGRIAPSDTYRIWKRGSNLRAHMTLAGFDGLRCLLGSNFPFLRGVFCEDSSISLPPGSLIVLAHKEKEITNALDGAGEDRDGWYMEGKCGDMLHVMVSVKSRRVPGAMTDEELFSMNDDDKLANCGEHDDYNGVLTAEERMQLDSALRTGNSDGLGDEGGA
ncbi:hypothetical protein HAX54_022303 [Datura stramonium]|uniref:Uncharacterized protein n=1 Tax=Datura stramonium TaxID=4076 RepID=A0ABS8S3Z6_DATST|nr:hypothetical protein [Datura stramonium]